MLKFRSMRAAPDDAAAESKQALSEDQRIFRFGRFMRRRSLDEFPQFWNVLVGEMSIVGPRPYMPILDEEFRQQTEGYRIRNLVKPGITGLSQSLGFRGAVLEEEMVRRRVYWDVYYITHWSVWLDVQITARTLLQVFRPPATAF
jgi:lipopolysaccharide/colanic/teichoic acid biosynthesis glycosyltransferase